MTYKEITIKYEPEYGLRVTSNIIVQNKYKHIMV